MQIYIQNLSIIPDREQADGLYRFTYVNKTFWVIILDALGGIIVHRIGINNEDEAVRSP